jgi:hypothetical protein
MGKTIWEEYKNQRKRITLVDGTIQKNLLTFFQGENGKIGPCIETFNVATPLWPNVGLKPNTSKVGDLESSGTPECLELDSKAQNTSH